jgi:PKD repeat protein
VLEEYSASGGVSGDAYFDNIRFYLNSPPVAVCQDVTVEVGLGCVADADVDGGSDDPDGDPITITQNPEGPYPLGVTVVTLTVNDGQASDTCTATVTVEDTTPPVVIAEVSPQLVGIGQVVNFNALVTDECDPTFVEWIFGDGDTSGDNNTTHAYNTAGHAYDTAGIYTVTLIVADSEGNQITQQFIVVVYDPSGGFVTGGGWIWSPAGAYIPDDTLEGEANFGFVAKYKKGANVPDGQTEFMFKAGDLNFHSTSYEWLVVTGSNYAKFKGTGTINGDVGTYGDYKFQIWAGDETFGGVDTFRIKIWEEDGDGNEFDVYDNGMDQPIEAGSIVVHTK